MDYELKFGKSPRSPRFLTDRLTPVDTQKLLQGSRSPIKPKSLFSSEKTKLFIGNSSSSFESICPTLINPLIRSQVKRRVPLQPNQSLPITEVLSDCYYTPIDWSIKDLIALALDTKIIMINPKQLFNKYTFHCHSADAVSLCFSTDGSKIALGSLLGPLRLFDVETDEPISTFANTGIDASVSSLKMSDSFIVSTHSNGYFIISDIRDNQPRPQVMKNLGRYCFTASISPEKDRVAVSYDGNQISVFDIRNIEKPIVKYSEHYSVVHSISWCPRDKNLIVSGGGINDYSLKIWNTQSGKTEKQVNTGSQICNVFWSKNYHEIISTQGFKENDIRFWNESDMKLTGTIKGHHDRILFSAISPDQNTLVTVTEKDPIQFWDMRQSNDQGTFQTIR